MTSPATAETGYANGGGPWWSQQAMEEVPELQWPLSTPVFRRMRTTDSTVKSSLAAVTSPIMRTRWFLEQGPARPEVAQHCASDMDLPLQGAPVSGLARTRDFAWNDHLHFVLLMLSYGHFFFQPVYRFDDTHRGPGAWHLRKLAPRPPWTLSRINVARDGGLISIVQNPAPGDTKPPETPVEDLVAYVYDREPGSWTGTSLLRAAYKNVLIKDPALRIWLQTIQRNGMGQPYYTAGPDEKSLERGLAMATAWQVGGQSGAAGPHGSLMQLLGVQGSLPNTREFVEYQDRSIRNSILANFLNLDAQGGSYALASVQESTFTQSLQGIAQQIADVTTQHVVRRLVDANWGPDEPAPRVNFEEIGSRQVATAKDLKFLVDSKLLYPDRPTEEAIRLQFGMPPKSTPTPGDVSV